MAFLDSSGVTTLTADIKALTDTAYAPKSHASSKANPHSVTSTQVFAKGPTVLTTDQYGTTLPAAGTAGRIFFLKV